MVPSASYSSSESPAAAKPGKKVKVNRRWNDEAVGDEAAALDYSGTANTVGVQNGSTANGRIHQGLQLTTTEVENLTKLRGTLREGFDELEVSSDEEYETSGSEEENDSKVNEKEVKVISMMLLSCADIAYCGRIFQLP